MFALPLFVICCEQEISDKSDFVLKFLEYKDQSPSVVREIDLTLRDMGKTIRRWLFNLHHIVIFASTVYTALILGDWLTVYYRDSKNPTLIFAYISLIQIPNILFLRHFLQNKTRMSLFIFVVLTASWIILTAIFVTLVYMELSE